MLSSCFMYIIDFGLLPTPLAWFAFLSFSGAGWVGVLAFLKFYSQLGKGAGWACCVIVYY